ARITRSSRLSTARSAFASRASGSTSTRTSSRRRKWRSASPVQLPPLDPPHHADRECRERRERENGGEQRRPVVKQREVREQSAKEEEREPDHRPDEDAESEPALPALEMRERKRQHHHHQHGGRIEDLVPECDLEPRRLLRVAAEHADVVVQRADLEAF